ncbi:MAG: Ig-like domain-containing protein, partial [Anaerolineae bacterium]|nr:Ig-like domain-containing protein [Anaerolineae bacterium]
FIEGVDTLGSIVAGNFIGTNAAGNAAVGNHFSGVEIRNGAANTHIGTATRPAERNVISGNWGNGIIVRYDTTTNTTITGNLIGTDPSGALAVPNRGIGILAQFATNVTIGTAAPGAGNTISNNWGPGIHILGAVVSVTNNVIQNNRQMGIYIEPSYGTTPDPATAADDRLPQPLIVGNQIDGNCTTIPIGCAGIYAIDTAPQNVDTLEADNTIGTNSTGNDVGQYWYGALEIISGNAPVAGAATITDNAGRTYPMTFNTTCAAVMNNTILHSISALSCANVYSWTLFTEFEVNAAGVRINHVPHTIAAPPTTYSYDADATTNPTDSGYGFIGEGITTGPFSRYQVMETTTSDPLPTVIATTPLNGAVGVALNADLTINFSEPVTASGAWFTIDCTLSGTHAAVVTGGPQNYTLNPATDFILGDVCTVTVLAASIRDLDVPQDNMAADYVFTFGVVDAPPFVASTTPADSAVDVPIAGSITVTFSEAVNTGAGWFDVTCSASGTHAGTVIGAAPAVAFTIDPTVDFDYNETCTVTVYAAQVSDTDLPADNMAADYTFTFTTAPVPVPGYASAPVNPGGTINFGSVLVGQTATQTLTITESGNADLVVDSWVLVDPNFTVTSAPALPATIADGSGVNVTLTITCTPFSAGLVSTILSIRHNAPGGIADYTLTCRGFVPPPTAIPPRDSFQSGTSSFDPAISKIGFLQPGQLGINGESIEWVITVFNPTGVSGQNVVFTDTLRPELRIERVETSKGTSSTSGQTVTVSIGDLAPAETVQISIFTTVLRGGATVENTACVTADNLTGERCATGNSVGTLPATGETPLAVWWVALGMLAIVSWSGWHLIRRIRD